MHQTLIVFRYNFPLVTPFLYLGWYIIPETRWGLNEGFESTILSDELTIVGQVSVKSAAEAMRLISSAAKSRSFISETRSTTAMTSILLGNKEVQLGPLDPKLSKSRTLPPPPRPTTLALAFADNLNLLPGLGKRYGWRFQKITTSEAYERHIRESHEIRANGSLSLVMDLPGDRLCQEGQISESDLKRVPQAVNIRIPSPLT